MLSVCSGTFLPRLHRAWGDPVQLTGPASWWCQPPASCSSGNRGWESRAAPWRECADTQFRNSNCSSSNKGTHSVCLSAFVCRFQCPLVQCGLGPCPYGTFHYFTQLCMADSLVFLFFLNYIYGFIDFLLIFESAQLVSFGGSFVDKAIFGLVGAGWNVNFEMCYWMHFSLLCLLLTLLCSELQSWFSLVI